MAQHHCANLPRRAGAFGGATRTSLVNPRHHQPHLFHSRRTGLLLGSVAVQRASFSTMPFSCFCLECVDTSTMGIQERFGNFVGILPPGMNCIMWPIDSVVGRVSARVQQLVCDCGTKTKDNVFVSVQVIVQYQVIVSQAYDAYYKLTDPHLQIRSYVEDIVRSTVPKMELDSAFEAKEELAHAIRDSLQQTMGSYGYTIIQSLVVDIRVDEKVKTAMNEINAAKRLREAAAEKAEADKIVQVKAAEASAESKYLNGLGIARERKAIVDGLRGSVEEFSETVEGATPKDVMDLILLTQYFDMLKDVGNNPNCTTLFMNHGPSAVTELKDQLLQGIMTKATATSS